MNIFNPPVFENLSGLFFVYTYIIWYYDFQELNPAIRFNLFVANPATKRISASIGARHRFPEGVFRWKGAVKRIKNHIKRVGKAENSAKSTNPNPRKIRNPQLNQEKTYKYLKKFKL